MEVAVDVRVGVAVVVQVDVGVLDGVDSSVAVRLGVRVGDEVHVALAMTPGVSVAAGAGEEGGGIGVPFAVGSGVHQNHPTMVPPAVRSSGSGFFPVSLAISGRMSGSTRWKTRNGQGP